MKVAATDLSTTAIQKQKNDEAMIWSRHNVDDRVARNRVYSIGTYQEGRTEKAALVVEEERKKPEKEKACIGGVSTLGSNFLIKQEGTHDTATA